MNGLRNCPICFKLFSFRGQSNVCPECSAKTDQDYLKVRRYLVDNSGATPVEVAEKTGVQIEVIFHLMRNRLIDN